ncbi:YfeC-like transcriptional regulator [Shigella flexneri]
MGRKGWKTEKFSRRERRSCRLILVDTQVSEFIQNTPPPITHQC